MSKMKGKRYKLEVTDAKYNHLEGEYEVILTDPNDLYLPFYVKNIDTGGEHWVRGSLKRVDLADEDQIVTRLN